MGDDLRPIVERAQKGDREAFGKLVRSHQRRVYATAHRMMGNHADADDVTQESFVRAFRGLPEFDRRSDFFTWLYRIVINVALNHLRRRKRQRSTSLDDVVLPATAAEDVRSDPGRALELKRVLLDVQEALDSLPETLKATVVLVILEGLAYRDAAEILDCSEGTVAWRVHEARQKLRQRLERHLTSRAGEAKSEDGLPGDTTEAIAGRR